MKHAAELPAVCASKAAYATYDAADLVASAQNRRKHGTKVGVYRCPGCDQYHLRSVAWQRRRA